MDRHEANTAKRELCEKLLAPGTVMLVLDARTDGVSVPGHLSGDPKLRLNIDYRYGAPMEIDDRGVRATLSFGGVEFDCILPWEAIYVLVPHTSGQPYVFPDDVPDEVLHEIGVEPRAEPRPALRLVTSPDEAAEAADTDAGGRDTEAAVDPESAPPERGEDPEREPPGGRRGHLRVVK